MIKSKQILAFFKTKTSNLGFIDRLKVLYRPYICPFDILLGYIKPNESVFDVGCGSGQFCALAAHFTDTKSIMGIEISDKLVGNAKKISQEFLNKNLIFKTYDGISIPEEIKNYSLIFLIDVLHHVPKRQQIDFLEEIYLKMALGSTLVLKDINASHPFVYFNKMHDLIFSNEIGNEMSFGFAQKTLEKIGFKLTEKFTTTTLVYPHYFIIVQK